MATAIAGLDLSLTSSGIAVLETTPPHVREQGECAPALLRSVGEAGKKTDSYVQRNRRIRTQTRVVTTLLADFRLRLVVIEGPIYAVKPESAGSYFDRAGLFHGVLAWLDFRNIPVAVIPPNVGHQFVTGKARPTLPDGKPDRKKLTVVWETRDWWKAGPRTQLGMPEIPPVLNGDQGDALGLAVMGAFHEGLKPPFRPAARHYNTVLNCEWPTPGKRPL